MRIHSRATVAEDAQGTTRPDTLGTHVWWLLSGETAGARNLVLNVGELPPRTAHRLHRHPRAEQAVLVVRGRGLHLTETGFAEVAEGDAIFIPVGEWHGFANPFEETVTIASVYGGVGDRAEAGYELHPDPPQVPGPDVPYHS